MPSGDNTLTVFLSVFRAEQFVLIQARAEEEGGSAFGTLRDFIRPGEDFHGHTYDELVRLGSGKQELEIPAPGGRAEARG